MTRLAFILIIFCVALSACNRSNRIAADKDTPEKQPAYTVTAQQAPADK